MKIHFEGYPTLTDGKVKVMWSDWEKKAMTRCFICRAGPKLMAHRRHKRFKPNKNHFKFGIASLHIRICAFLWLCKTFIYQDVKAYAKKKGDGPLCKQRLEELRLLCEERLGLDVFKCSPGSVSVSITLSTAYNDVIFPQSIMFIGKKRANIWLGYVIVCTI